MVPGSPSGQTPGVDGLDGSLRIAGEPCPGALGGSFETRARRYPWHASRRWARAEPADVEAALGAASQALGPWRALARGERLERLLAAQAELERAPVVEVLAEALGLAEGELAPRHAEGLFRFREGLEILRDGSGGGAPGARPAAGAFCAHWSELAAELGLRLAARLVEGHAALLVSDPWVPEGAALVAAALERAGLPPGTVSLLHDDRRGALRKALAEGALGWLRVRGSREALEGFAAGGGGAGERSLWPLSNTSAVVLEGDDPARAAGELALKALGRSGTLSGQLPGQVGRVICHQRLFSRFSEEFLHGLEDGPVPDLGPPVPAIEGDLPAYVRRAWALGLDEGATPIHGGEPLVRAAAAPGTAPGAVDGPAPATEPDPALQRGRAPRVVLPVVFTNVEPGRRLARLRRPAPVVLLMRASSDEAARELATELDRG